MRPYGRKNPLPFPYSLSSANFAVLSQKETGFKRVETLVSILLPTAVGTANSCAPQSATLRLIQAKNLPPIRGEHANAVRVPRSAGAEKGAAPSGRTRLRQFASPAQPVLKKAAARQGRTRLRQFACPSQPVLKNSRPSGANRLRSSRTPVNRC